MAETSQRPQPLTFGLCGRCAYLRGGTPTICFACARQTMHALPQRRCPTCDLPFDADADQCGNPICGWDDRWFGRNFAAALRSGVLEEAINSYKYGDRRGWAQIFARVLVGFLNEERDTFRRFDLIVALPTYVGDDGRSWDHTRLVVVEAEALAEGAWPFDTADPPAITKIAATERLTGKSWRQRFEIARGPLRAALAVPDPAKTRRRKILVYDDVFTDGQTLNEVARCLRLAGGASEVCGITLARQPYRQS